MKKLSNTPQRSKDPSGIMASVITALALSLLSVTQSSAQLPAEINLGEGDADATIFGPDAGGSMTSTGGIVIGDINGDGKDDFALSVSMGDGPSSNPQTNIGEVHVFFGSDSIAATTDLANASADLTIYGPNEGSMLGYEISLAIGDVNGDGIGDLIMGAPYTTSALFDGADENGALFILYGSPGLGGEVDLSTAAGLKGGSGIVTILGADNGDLLGGGTPLVVGDVNGDGIGDLVIGVPYGDGFENAGNDDGEVYVIYGSDSLPDVINLASVDADGPDVRIYGSPGLHQGLLTLSGTLVLADVSGDGLLDILMGEERAQAPANLPGPAIKGDNKGGLPPRVDSGIAYVVFGSESLASEIELGLGDADVEIYGGSPDDLLTSGGALAAGDVNGDGIDDIVLGSGKADGLSEDREDAGEAYIIFGGASLAAIIDLYPGGVKGVTNPPDVTIYGSDTMGALSTNGALILSDFNGDGFQDVAVGAPLANGTPLAPRSRAGAVYIIFGAANLASIFDASASHAGAVNPVGISPDVAIRGEAEFDGLSLSRGLVVGDLNGDGTMDLTVISSANDLPEAKGSGTNEGAAFVIFGSDVLEGEIDLAMYGADVRIQGADVDDRLGNFGASDAGDVTGDGVDDLLLGAAAADGAGNSLDGAGDAYVINGQTVSATATVTMTDAAGDPLARDYGTARARVDFSDGTSSSFTTVTLTRSSVGISNLADAAKLSEDEIVNVVWEITTDRAGFTTADIELRYTDSEAGGFEESSFVLMQAAALSGPWFAVPGQELVTATNTILATVNSFSFFALAADATPPSVTIEKGLGQADPAMMLPVVFDVVFTEAVTGFEASDVVFSGTAGSPVAEISEVKANAYTVSITSVRSEGTLIVSIPADAAIDTVGNPSTASTSTNNTVTLDGDFTPPTVTVEQGADQEDPAPVPIVFDVMFSEDVTGFDATDVVIGGTATGAVATVTVVDGANYTIEITEVATFGTVTVSLDAGAATDLAAAANPSDASTSADNTVTVEEVTGCSASPGARGAGTPSSDFAVIVVAALALMALRRRRVHVIG